MFRPWFLFTTAAASILLNGLGCSDKAQFTAGVSPRMADASRDNGASDLDPLNWEQRFPAAVFAETRLELGGDFSSALMTIPLVEEQAGGTLEFQQRSREAFEDRFTQGGLRQSMSESFQQNDLGILDIVLVVDNSHSMRQEQENIAARMAPLTSMISNTSWQIAITSTDPADGCVTKLIKAGDSDKETRFSEAILGLGVQGTRNEVGLYQAKNALECQDPSWLRPSSNVAIIILSDEDNCSRGNDCGPYAGSDKASYLTDYLKTIRTPGVDAKVYGIIWEPGTACADGGFEAPIYQQVVRETKGLTGNICSPDYTPILSSISKDIASSLKKQVQLSSIPVSGTMRVAVDGQDWSNQITVSGQSIVFKQVPPANSRITINYERESTPMINRFVLSRSGIDSESLKVYVNDSLANDVTFNADDNSIGFASAPGANAAIRVHYSKVESLSRKFFIGKNLSPGSLEVRVDGAVTTNFRYDPTDGQLTFGIAPEPMSRISVSYARMDPQLTYPFKTPGIKSLSVSLASKPDTPVAAMFVEDSIIIRAEDFRAGDSLLIRYETTMSEPGVVTIPHTPYGDLVLEAETSDCAQGDLTIEGDRLTARCTLAQGETLAVRYRHVAALRRVFRLDVRDPDGYAWRVFIDDEETTAFKRNGALVELDQDPPVSATITVRGEQSDGA